MKLTDIRLIEGVWEGLLTDEGGLPDRPVVAVTHQETPVDGAELVQVPDKGGWLLRVPIPVKSISSGVQTFLVREVVTGDVLGSFTLIAGEALDHDIRAEVDLLRAELDMLKRSFRRHCLETM